MYWREHSKQVGTDNGTSCTDHEKSVDSKKQHPPPVLVRTGTFYSLRSVLPGALGWYQVFDNVYSGCGRTNDTRRDVYNIILIVLTVGRYILFAINNYQVLDSAAE